jgi:hypothetical protein
MQNRGSQETSKRGARCLKLQVLFVAGGGGLAAHQAAHWTNRLANGCLEIGVAAPCGADLTAALNGTPADLVVVIHTPGDPGPRVAYHCGGRIDWDLEAESPADRMLRCAGMSCACFTILGAPGDSDIPVAHFSYPPTLHVPKRLDAHASLLAA